MPRILVVDDDASIRATLGILLELAGHAAVLVGDGRSGVQAVASEDFDVLIVDVFMPEMDGFEFVRWARTAKPALPIIAISGAPFGMGLPLTPDFLGMLGELGAVRTIRKPFKPADLNEAIQACLVQR